MGDVDFGGPGTGRAVTSLFAAAPAKLNLGLAVLGRRADGFHDIATIMQTVSIVDDLTLTAISASDIRLTTDDANLATEDNLVLTALRALRYETSSTAGIAAHLVKRIPAAAGLGGASSDAAAALVLGRALWQPLLSDDILLRLASGIGSDVPFFLRGGTELATGRGEMLTPLPPLSGITFVVVVPRLSEPLPRKTATLYAALRPEYFGGADSVNHQVDRIRAGLPLDPDLLANTFAAPLYDLRPELKALATGMSAAGAPFVALSGAGPAHYTAFARADDARAVADRLQRGNAFSGRIFVCDPIPASGAT